MARKTGSVNHTHKYYKRPDGLWACAGLEDCTHYMPKNMAPAPSGRMSICWGSCGGNKFQLTPANMEMYRPMCDACVEEQRIATEYLDEMGMNETPTGLAAFGAHMKSKSLKEIVEEVKTMQNFKPKKEEEKDQIEIIEPDEVHTSECSVYETGECNCK